MRKLAAIALLFSANAAFACPDLTGAYTCTYQNGSSEVVTVSQQLVNGVTVYNYNGSQIPADNIVYQVPDDQSLKNGTFRAWCDDAVTLKAELIGQYYDQGAYYGDLSMIMNFSIEGSSLKQVTTGTLKNSAGEYPLNSEKSCSPHP